jgi:KDO2-lipid IV(A) lauroyltransferase
MPAPESLERPSLAAGLLARVLSSNRKTAATRQAYGRVGHADDRPALDRLVSANLLFTAGYYARCWSLTCEPGRRRLRRTIQPVGDEYLRDATATDRGAILLAVHLGDFDLAGHWVASELGRRLVVASKAVRPAWRGALYEQIRSRAGFQVRRQDQTTLRDLTDALDDGQIVLFLADRRSPGRNLPFDFLGCPSVLSAAPSWLSARTGAPILTAATFTLGQRRQLLFGPPRWAAEPGDNRWVAPALAELEASIRWAPHQWHIPADLTQLAVSVEPSAVRVVPAEARSAIRQVRVEARGT